MTATQASTAASLVDPIKAEYQEVMKVENTALPHAIKCGELLKIAKDTVKASRGDWKNWREVNCPEISQETVSLYIRLAEHKDLIARKKATSIRKANEIVREHKNPDDKCLKSLCALGHRFSPAPHYFRQPGAECVP